VRLVSLVSAALVLLVVAPARGQDWIEYTSREDFFTINFPGNPTVRNTTYETEYGLMLPARVHSRDTGKGRYSVMVVQFANIAKLHAQRLQGCDKYPNLCADPTVFDLRGAMDFAAGGLLRKAAKVSDYAYTQTERVEGRRMQLVNADGSQTFVTIHMHENRLYIIEGTVPAGLPPPALFQQSLGFVDKDGFRVRYDTPYSNLYPAPPRVQYPGMPPPGR
jgi:hypothetical protein